MTNNMQLWNNVCTTDAGHTKRVEFGRKFTAIDAMYQIKSATEQFGVAGEGWGWFFSDPIFPPNNTVVIKCTLWHGDKNNTVEQFGQKSLGDKKTDEDAFKKAGTDALTKCLSYLGFNADVFLGKFDDNKYVQQATIKVKAKEIKAKSTNILNAINEAVNLADLEDIKINYKDDFLSIKQNQELYDELIARASDKKAEILNRELDNQIPNT